MSVYMRLQCSSSHRDVEPGMHPFSTSIHYKEVASKARRMLFMIRRSFAELPVSVFSPLYNTLVRPYLEYAMQACSPNLVADAD